VVRYGDGAAKLEGKELSRFMSVLKEYLAFFDKVDKRVRDERVTELLAKLDLSKHGDFEGDKKTPPAKLVKLEKQLKGLAKDRGFKSVELQFDDEHNLWQAVFVNAHGVTHTIHWELASSAEYRQMMTKFKLIENYMEPPFVIEAVARPSASEKDAEGEESEAAEAEEKSDKKNVKTAAKRKVEVEIVEKMNARDLFEYVKKAGTRGYDVQRYKGLGEMTAPQLWETTMDPERRTLLLVRLEDIAECETIFTTLMGEDVEARRKFIEENALDVKNLDI
jgi:DNA gyrase subunit B